MIISQGRELLLWKEISRYSYVLPLSFSTSQGFSLREWVLFCHSFSKLANFKEALTCAQHYVVVVLPHT